MNIYVEIGRYIFKTTPIATSTQFEYKVSVFFFSFIIAPFEKAIYNDVFPKIAAKRGVPMPSYEEAIYNASLMLVNSDPSVGTAFRLPQNVKYIGGYHIDGTVKPLSEVDI